MSDKDTIYRQDAIDAMCSACGYDCDEREFVYNAPQGEQVIMCPGHYALSTLPSAEPKRIWTPCDIPPKHHRDVIVRGVEAIGGECVYKVMQWDVDTWRPKNYAPSITWLDWSEI